MNEFICNICKVSFSIELKAKRSKRCIECQRAIKREQDKVYRSNPINYSIMCQNREEYELKNKDKIRERRKEYTANNKDKLKENREKHKDKNAEKGKQKRMNALTPVEDLDINTQWDLAGYKNSSYDPSYTLTPKRKRNIMRLDNKFTEAEGSKYEKQRGCPKPSEMNEEQKLKYEAFMKTLNN
jgi:hypothetical protein